MIRVKDGDTLVLGIDLGLDVVRRITIRLNKIDTPKLKEEGGPEAREKMLDLLDQAIRDDDLTIRTVKLKRGDRKGRDKRGKYGRYIATLYSHGKNLNEIMVKERFAKRVNW